VFRALRQLAFVAVACANLFFVRSVDAGRVADRVAAARSNAENLGLGRKGKHRALLDSALARKNVSPDALTALFAARFSGRELVSLLKNLETIDGIPGVDESLAALAQARGPRINELLSQLDSTTRLARAGLDIAGTNVRTAAGDALDVVLRDGTVIQTLWLRGDGGDALPLGDRMRQLAKVEAGTLLAPDQTLALEKDATLGTTRLLMTTGDMAPTTDNLVRRLRIKGARNVHVFAASALSIAGAPAESIADTFREKAARAKRAPLSPTVAARYARDLINSAPPPIKSVFRAKPALRTTLEKLFASQQITAPALQRLITQPLLADRLGELLPAVHSLERIPGVDVTLERLITPKNGATMAGMVFQILRTAELHAAKGVVAMGLPLPGQSLDIDAITRDGAVYEIKLFSKRRNADDAIRSGVRELWRLKHLLVVFGGQLPLRGRRAAGNQLVFFSRDPLTADQAQVVVDTARTLGIRKIAAVTNAKAKTRTAPVTRRNPNTRRLQNKSRRFNPGNEPSRFNPAKRSLRIFNIGERAGRSVRRLRARSRR